MANRGRKPKITLDEQIGKVKSEISKKEQEIKSLKAKLKSLEIA